VAPDSKAGEVMSNKLCYILPEYSEDTQQHFYHLYELLNDVSQKLDIFLLIESGEGKPRFAKISNIYTMRFKLPPLRLLEHIIVFSYIRFKGYKTFYVHYSSVVTLIWALTRILGGTTYLWHCGQARDFFVDGWKLDWDLIKRKIFNDYRFILTLKSTDYLVTGSPYMAEYYHENFGIKRAKIKIMPNWVNLDRFNPRKYQKQQIRNELGITQDKQVVLFVHHLAPRKGAHHLVKIAETVIKKVPQAIFLIVGDGPYRGKLEQEIKERHLESVLRLVGNVPNRDIARYYAVADLFIMPSEQEAFGRVLLEAMAMGTPFVATYHGTMDTLLTGKQKELIVPQGDIGSFCHNVVRALSDASLRDELTQEGKRNVVSYTLNAVAPRFIEIVTGKDEGKK